MSIQRFATALGVGIALYGSVLAGAGAETLKIGVIAPLSGPGAPWGMAMAEGAKILASTYNDEGGIDVGGTKYQIQVIAYDDEYKSPEAIAVYNRLVYQDGVKYLAIAAGSSTMAVKQYLEDDKIVGMTAGFVANELDPNSRYMYRMWGIPADYYPPLYD